MREEVSKEKLGELNEMIREAQRGGGMKNAHFSSERGQIYLVWGEQ